MKILGNLTVAAVLVLATISAAHASSIHNSATGLSGNFTTETFATGLPDGTSAGANFYGISFGDNNEILTYPAAYTNIHGQAIHGYPSPTSISFAAPIYGAAFNFLTAPTTTVFTAFLGGVEIENFSASTGYDGAFFGFREIVFDRIRIDAPPNYGYAMDNLEVQAVPEPSTHLIMLIGLGFLGFATYRRKSL